MKSFRALFRLGDEDTKSLKITVGPFAAWVSAFAHWFGDTPPTIYYIDETNAIQEQPDSKVTIYISTAAKYKHQIGIETIHGYESVSEVVQAVISDGKPTLVTGMVNLETHAT